MVCEPRVAKRLTEASDEQKSDERPLETKKKSGQVHSKHANEDHGTTTNYILNIKKGGSGGQWRNEKDSPERRAQWYIEKREEMAKALSAKPL